MTEQRELDRLLATFFVDGSNELPDRVVDAALDEIDHTRQRRRPLAPWRFPTMSMPVRLGAAALIGVLALGGAMLLTGGGGRPSTPAPTSNPSASPAAVVSPTAASAWRITGSPSVDRGNSLVAVRLVDGRMLLAGGGKVPLSSAELYDPTSGAWAMTGAMSIPRSYPIAVRLADGRVLVAGGSDSGADTAEIFDPTTGTWTATGSMNDGRNQGFGVVLADGRVLAFGGGNDGGKKSAELFDPTKGSWTPTGDMTTVRAGPLGATLLQDRRVLVTGGFTDDNRSAEIYDQTTGKWTATTPMIVGRGDEQSAITLSDGRVLVSGGQPTTSELFDPTTGRWTLTGSMAETYTDLVVLNEMFDGKILLVGGGSSRGGGTATGQWYDPSYDTWSAVDPLAQGTFVRAARLLSDGTVLVVSSSTTDVGGQPGAEIYRPPTGP